MTMDLNHWLTIDEAAHTLGWSTKTIRRRGLQLRKRPVPGRTAETVVCPEDVARFMQTPPTALVPARDIQDTSVSTVSNGVPAVPLSDVPPQDSGFPLEAIATLIQEALRAALPPPPPAPPPPDPMFVRVDRATEITGLSDRMLKRLAKLGALDGVRDQRVVKLRRADLEVVDISKVAMDRRPAPKRAKKRRR